MPAKARCRHRDTWLIAVGYYEWCYRCGALRRMRETEIDRVTPVAFWCRPVGPYGDNPWSAWFKRSKRKRKESA